MNTFRFFALTNKIMKLFLMQPLKDLQDYRPSRSLFPVCESKGQPYLMTRNYRHVVSSARRRKKTCTHSGRLCTTFFFISNVTFIFIFSSVRIINSRSKSKEEKPSVYISEITRTTSFFAMFRIVAVLLAE